MTEHDLTRDLLTLLREEFEDRLRGVVFKHADYATTGIPDITTTLYARTAWWEVKRADPFIKGTGLQHLTARRLASAGHCWYIVYEEILGRWRTCLVRPQDVDATGRFSCLSHWTNDINHQFVLDFMRRVHHV